MAHNLATIDGKTAMFCVGDRKAAWHELGQRTENAVNWLEAMKQAGLDWEVEKIQLGAPIERLTSNWVQVEAWGIVREPEGVFLGTVGEDYGIVQNREAFAFVDNLLEAENGAHYESAGALGKGERIWCLARIPSADFAVAGADQHETYLLFTTSHDGSMSVISKITTVRVVCQNTLSWALNEAGKAMLKVKHTKNVTSRLEMAAEVMQGVRQDTGSLAEKLKLLSTRTLTKETTQVILDRLFPKPKRDSQELVRDNNRRENVLAKVLELYELNDNNAYPQIRGTAYNLLNAVTEYTDHLRGTRLTTDRKDAGYTVPMARAENTLFGSGNALKSKALDVILETTTGASISGSLLDAVVAQS